MTVGSFKIKVIAELLIVPRYCTDFLNLLKRYPSVAKSIVFKFVLPDSYRTKNKLKFVYYARSKLESGIK